MKGNAFTLISLLGLLLPQEYHSTFANTQHETDIFRSALPENRIRARRMSKRTRLAYRTMVGEVVWLPVLIPLCEVGKACDNLLVPINFFTFAP